MTIRVAVSQYPVSRLANWQAFEQKLSNWLDQAHAEGAQLVCFPEYAAMELVSLSNETAPLALDSSLLFMQTLHDDFVALFSRKAKALDMFILAGSFPVLEEGRYVNRAYVFGPSGLLGYQDKIQMTRFEKEEWGISAGSSLRVFDTQIGRFAVNICYDSEFPYFARQVVEAGADFILVPSCTDTPAGYHRVRVGCQARALENQVYVLQSPLVGNAPWSLSVDVNLGKASCFGPIDYGFAENGVLAEGDWNETQYLFVDLDIEKLSRVRVEGQVTNFLDWPNQCAVTLEHVNCVK